MFCSIIESSKEYKYRYTGGYNRISNRVNRRSHKNTLRKEIKKLLEE